MANTHSALDEVDARIAWLKDELRKATEVRAIIRGWDSPTTQTRVDEDPDKPMTTKTWITRVLSGGSRYTGAEIARRALDLGWVTTAQDPAIVVRNTLREMVKKGEVRREGKVYMLPTSLTVVQDAMV